MVPLKGDCSSSILILAATYFNDETKYFFVADAPRLRNRSSECNYFGPDVDDQ